MILVQPDEKGKLGDKNEARSGEKERNRRRKNNSHEGYDREERREKEEERRKKRRKHETQFPTAFPTENSARYATYFCESTTANSSHVHYVSFIMQGTHTA